MNIFSQRNNTSQQDTRAASAVQMKSSAQLKAESSPSELQEAANNSPQVMQQKSYQAMADSSSQVSQLMSYQAMADNYTGETVQRKEQQAVSPATAPPVQRMPNNTGLPDKLKANAEAISGESLDDIKVHYNSSKPAQLQAHAYAQGSDIHLAPGQEKHLGHETWHTIQQKQGRVQANTQLKGKVNVNNEDHLEKEADIMGAKISSMETPSTAPTQLKSTATHNASQPVQRQVINTVGGEMEASGLALLKVDGEHEVGDGMSRKEVDERSTPVGDGEIIVQGEGWKIESDNGNPEIVVTYANDPEVFLRRLAEAYPILADATHRLSALREKPIVKGEEEAKTEYSDEKVATFDADKKYLLALKKGGDSLFKAQPQITIGVGKGSLGTFYNKSQGRVPIGQEVYEGQKLSKVVNVPVLLAGVADSVQETMKGGRQGAATDIKDVVNGGANNDAEGLIGLTVYLFKAAQESIGVEANEFEYRKASLSILNRVPLSEMYDALDEEGKRAYRAGMEVYLNNFEKPDISPHFSTLLEKRRKRIKYLESKGASVFDPMSIDETEITWEASAEEREALTEDLPWKWDKKSAKTSSVVFNRHTNEDDIAVYAHVKQVYASIISTDGTNRHKKTHNHGSFDERKTDFLSSDKFIHGKESAADTPESAKDPETSIGYYSLPTDGETSGVFEIRSMPAIDYSTWDNVASIFTDYIRYYQQEETGQEEQAQKPRKGSDTGSRRKGKGRTQTRLGSF